MEGKGEKELQRHFFLFPTSSFCSLKGLSLSFKSNFPESFNFMGQITQLRYYYTGRKGKEEEKHYHKVKVVLGPPPGGQR